jgi:CO/xanthine dehydrogenase FAD-binding subunit
MDKDARAGFDVWKSGSRKRRLSYGRVQVIQPETIEEALRARGETPDLIAVAGGTEVMPARNQGRRPGRLLDLTRIADMQQVGDGDPVRIGAGVTCTRLIEELGERVPVLAIAARTIGSRQIRNRATLGGAVALADPSGDLLAALLASGAEVEASGPAGTRRVPLEKFLTGPYTTDLRRQELVTALHVRSARGPAAYAKVGARNAMARAACAVAVAIDLPARRAVIALAAVGPSPLRAGRAEELFSAGAPWDQRAELDPQWLSEVGSRAAQECAPRSDRRGSAGYKRHAVAILTARALARAWRARSEPPWA